MAYAEPVELLIRGEVAEEITYFSSEENVTVGVRVEGGYVVKGINVFTQHPLQKELGEAFDFAYNKTVQEFDYENNFTFSTTEDFSASFVIKYEDFENKLKAVRKDLIFVMQEPPPARTQTKAFIDPQTQTNHLRQDSVIDEGIDGITISINKKEEPENVTVKPGGQVELRVDLPGGIVVKSITVRSDNAAIQEFLRSLIPQRLGRTVREEQIVKRVTLPSQIPTGKHGITIEIDYLNKEFEEKRYSYSFDLTFAEGSALASYLAEKTLQPKTRKIRKDLNLNDLNKANLEDLGIDVGSFFTVMQELSRLKEKHRTDKEIRDELQPRFGLYPSVKLRSESLQVVTYETVQKNVFFGSIGSYKHRIPVTLHTLIYDFSYGEKTITKTRIVIELTGPQGTGELIYALPVDVGLISWELDTPEVIAGGVRWPLYGSQKFSFVVDADLENEVFLAAAGINEPGVMVKLLKWFAELFG